MTANQAIGVDIGGSHISSALVDLDEGRLCSQVRTDRVSSKGSAEEILSVWAANISATASLAETGAQIRTGFAFPGPFDYPRGISLIRGVDKYESIFSMDVSSSLRTRLQFSCDFRYINDASAFGIGESWFGAGRSSRKTVALTLGTGVGSCFIDSRKALTEGEGVPENGYVYNLPFEDGIVDESFSTRWIVRRWLELTGERIFGAVELAAVKDTNPNVRVLFNEYAARLATFALKLLPPFRADTLLLGGNIARFFPLFGEELVNLLREGGLDTEVVVSELFDNAAIIGAAALFKE